MRRYGILATFVCLAVGAIHLHFAGADPQPQPQERSRDAAKAQEAAWQRLRSMAGTWDGAGESASSRVEQSYELILQDHFLLTRTKSVSKEETHEDWEILSYDGVRDKVMLRQFVSEGYVNRFVLDQISDDERTFVFLSEACENAPPGFRARQTLTFQSDEKVSQQLELAGPGKEFSRCAGNTLTRRR